MSIPTSVVIMGLVALWLAILVPMFAKRREPVPETDMDTGTFRVLRRASGSVRRRPALRRRSFDDDYADQDDMLPEDHQFDENDAADGELADEFADTEFVDSDAVDRHQDTEPVHTDTVHAEVVYGEMASGEDGGYVEIDDAEMHPGRTKTSRRGFRSWVRRAPASAEYTEAAGYEAVRYEVAEYETTDYEGAYYEVAEYEVPDDETTDHEGARYEAAEYDAVQHTGSTRYDGHDHTERHARSTRYEGHDDAGYDAPERYEDTAPRTYTTASYTSYAEDHHHDVTRSRRRRDPLEDVDETQLRPVPRRPGRGGYDPDAAEAARAYRYSRRRRVALILLVATVVFAVAAYFLDPVLWTGAAVFGLLLVAFLAYLRRQVKIENDITARRAARLRRARQIRPEYHAGHEDAPVTGAAFGGGTVAVSQVPPSGYRRGREIVDLEDDDPSFDDLEYYQPALYRRASGQ